MRKVDSGQRGRKTGQFSSAGGFILVTTVIMIAGLIFLAAVAAIRSSRQTQVTAVEVDDNRTFYAAEGAIEWGSNELRNLLQNNLDPAQAQLDALPLPQIEGFQFDNYRILKVGALTAEVITEGDYTGLRGYVQRYSIQTEAATQRRATTLDQEIQHQFIPLFQFGVFYESDLEIIPGPLMTFVGPIHTNANLYMASENEMQCTSTVTAVGRYWHHRKDGSQSDPPGLVKIKDRNDTWQNVWRGSYWLDNRRPSWASEAMSVWGGNLRDQAHGVSTLRLPVPPAADQHITIERGVAGDTQADRDAKYWYKATVRFVDGALKNNLGQNLNQPGVYAYAANVFYDDRENKWADVVTVNIQAMVNGNYRPPNGIVYVSDNRGDFPVVRIINATTIPVGGLTIISDRPMYTKGNYNSTAKKGSALYCDALTLLSPNWNDANSSGGLSGRVPTNLTVNACVLTGHVGTPDGGNYSGGLENNFRFLENWTTQTVTYRGSIIDLWFSRYATQPWVYGGYYTAPQRNWGFDTDLTNPANWPPGTPRAQTIQRGKWRQIS